MMKTLAATTVALLLLVVTAPAVHAASKPVPRVLNAQLCKNSSWYYCQGVATWRPSAWELAGWR